MPICACGLCGLPTMGGKYRQGHNRKGTPDNRFDKLFVKKGPNECWPPKRKRKNDYMYLSFWDGERNVMAHRFALERKLGRPIRKGYCACHTCDNPQCLNPDHLIERTQGWNTKDRDRKGRTKWKSHPGEENGRAKLTKEAVLYSKKLRDKGYTYVKIREKIKRKFDIDVGENQISLAIKRIKVWNS